MRKSEEEDKKKKSPSLSDKGVRAILRANSHSKLACCGDREERSEAGRGRGRGKRGIIHFFFLQPLRSSTQNRPDQHPTNVVGSMNLGMGCPNARAGVETVWGKKRLLEQPKFRPPSRIATSVVTLVTPMLVGQQTTAAGENPDGEGATLLTWFPQEISVEFFFFCLWDQS